MSLNRDLNPQDRVTLGEETPRWGGLLQPKKASLAPPPNATVFSDSGAEIRQAIDKWGTSKSSRVLLDILSAPRALFDEGVGAALHQGGLSCTRAWSFVDNGIPKRGYCSWLEHPWAAAPVAHLTKLNET